MFEVSFPLSNALSVIIMITQTSCSFTPDANSSPKRPFFSGHEKRQIVQIADCADYAVKERDCDSNVEVIEEQIYRERVKSTRK